MGPRRSSVRIVGIALLSVLVVALGQSTTTPATASEPSVVASADLVLGTWVAQIGTAVIRFDEDGTLRSAHGAAMLESAPYAINSYRFEDGVMLVTEVVVRGVPSCGGAVGRYKVWLLERGHLHIVAIDDSCEGRASDMTREYEPTESAGSGVVTSAERILGTWMAQLGTAVIRFEEDGACREAFGVSMLEAGPLSICAYRFDGAVMLLTEVEVFGVESCDDVGRYQVRLLENGALRLVPIEDACVGRRDHLASRVYERVE